MTIKELARRMKSTPVQGIVDQAARDSQVEIADVQREQMRRGENALSQPIGTYSPGYLRFKKTLSSYRAPLGVPDLFLTGAYHKSIRMAVSRGEYKLYATDSKAGKLSAKYGDIMGLNENSRPEARKVTTREMTKIIRGKWFA
jgi:hypothetical protein